MNPQQTPNKPQMYFQRMYIEWAFNKPQRYSNKTQTKLKQNPNETQTKPQKNP